MVEEVRTVTWTFSSKTVRDQTLTFIRGQCSCSYPGLILEAVGEVEILGRGPNSTILSLVAEVEAARRDLVRAGTA